MNKLSRFLLSMVAALGSLVCAGAAPMTNADVIKMVQASLDETIIVTSIEHAAEAGFDTSTDGLIALSQAKVPQPIVAAMIKRAAGGAKPAAAGAPAQDDPNIIKPSEIYLIDGGATKPMQYIVSQTRTAARALGMGGVASYCVMRGKAAALRVKNAAPAFLIAVPKQAQPDSYFTLASFAVRKNGSREVLTGGGYMSYSTGIHKDRVVAVTSEKLADQSRAAKDFIIYKVTPAAPLPAGEYAMVLYTGEMQGLVGAWFAGNGNSCFDFGVDK
jgi:hypothetical protein